MFFRYGSLTDSRQFNTLSVHFCLQHFDRDKERLAVRDSRDLDGTGYQHRGYSWLIVDCVLRKFKYVQNKGTSIWNFMPNSELGRCFFATASRPPAGDVNVVRLSPVCPFVCYGRRL